MHFVFGVTGGVGLQIRCTASAIVFSELARKKPPIQLLWFALWFSVRNECQGYFGEPELPQAPVI